MSGCSERPATEPRDLPLFLHFVGWQASHRMARATPSRSCTYTCTSNVKDTFCSRDCQLWERSTQITNPSCDILEILFFGYGSPIEEETALPLFTGAKGYAHAEEGKVPGCARAWVEHCVHSIGANTFDPQGEDSWSVLGHKSARQWREALLLSKPNDGTTRTASSLQDSVKR